MNKRIFFGIVMAILCTCILSVGVYAADEVASGTCGDNLTWVLDSEGTLTISGTGDMWDYSTKTNNYSYITTAPWNNYISSIEKLTFVNGITSIGENAFYGCDKIAGEIIFPDTITIIGDMAFHSCYCIEDVIIPSSVTDIGEAAFAVCNNLNNITIAKGIRTIGDYAFLGCSNLKEISIPDSLLHLGFGAFADCSKLESITLPLVMSDLPTENHLGYIFEARWYTDNNTLVPESLKKVNIIGNADISINAFYYCENIREITILGEVEKIHSNAFEWCSALESLTISEFVKEIGDDEFLACPLLTTINYCGTIAQWDSIIKGTRWDRNTSDYTIYCTDGTISKSGKITYFASGASLITNTSQASIGDTVYLTISANAPFSAAELSLTYDNAYLTFNKSASTINTASVTDTNGTLTLTDSGEPRSSYTLAFDTIKAGTAEITLTSAAFSDTEDAEEENLIPATISTAAVSVVIKAKPPKYDFNKDGVFNMADAVYLMWHFINPEEYPID